MMLLAVRQPYAQQIPCFDRCQLTITRMSNIKDAINQSSTKMN